MMAPASKKALLFLQKKKQKNSYFPPDLAPSPHNVIASRAAARQSRNAPPTQRQIDPQPLTQTNNSKSFLLLFFKKEALASYLLLTSATAAAAQTATSPGYFMPPSSPVLESRPITQKSPVIDDTLVDNLPAPAPVPIAAPLPWYETDWGVLGIGVLATAASLSLDKTSNHFAQTNLSYSFRKDYALKFADALELAPLAFAGLTMIQSPISDPELAHASSIAFASAAEVTVLSMGIKYVVGRDRPGGPNSDPFVAQPVDAKRSTFSIGAVLPGFGEPTSSFPSGHTTLAFALVTPYAEIYHDPWLYAIPVAVGAGRVAAVDGHWLSDVVGGGFIGWLTADLTRRYFPNSDFGLMIFGDGRQMQVGFSGRF